jgi:hypothetical protein
VKNKKSAKELWDGLNELYSGSEDVKVQKKHLLTMKYENFRYVNGESLSEQYYRFIEILDSLEGLGISTDDKKAIMKFSTSLPTKWNTYTNTLKRSYGFPTMTLSECFGKLNADRMEMEVKESLFRTGQSSNGSENAALHAGGSHMVTYQQPQGSYYSAATEGSRSPYVTYPETPRSNSSPFMDEAHGAFM